MEVKGGSKVELVCCSHTHLIIVCVTSVTGTIVLRLVKMCENPADALTLSLRNYRPSQLTVQLLAFMGFQLDLQLSDAV